MLEEIIKKIIKQNIVKAAIGTVVLVLVVAVVISFSNSGGLKTISAKDAGAKAVDFINKNFLAGKGGATFKNVVSESGLYKVTFTYLDNDNQIYVTKDGKYLFPIMQGVPIDMSIKPAVANANAANTGSGQQQAPQTCDAINKTDAPVLLAFVVSKCPFGLQMQRILANALSSAPALAKNVKVMYISSDAGNGKFTAMHGDDEYQENLKQICIREEQNSKYWSYISCHIKKGETTGCLQTAGVDQAKLNSCVADSSRGTKYIKDDYVLQQKYNVSGSPTLVQNDQTVSEFSFGGRTADAIKTLVCCGSKSQPGFCSQTLSKESAATSFSETYTQAGTGSSGNSGAGGANCAPAQ